MHIHTDAPRPRDRLDLVQYNADLVCTKQLSRFEFKNVRYEYFEEAHKGHGRVELRGYWISDMLDTISNPGRWASLQGNGMLESERYINGKTTSETRYFIVSIAPNAKIFANAVRKHWAIES